MHENKSYSTLYLIGRSLIPSAIGVAVCLCFGACLIGLHMLMLSLSLGTSLPTVLDGQWGIAYTNSIVQPLQTLFNNLAFNNVLIIVLWGVAGLATYFLFEYIVYIRRDWRAAENEIQMVGERRIVLHPARATFLLTVLWRMGVLVAAAIVFIAMQPLLQFLVSADSAIVAGDLPIRVSILKITLELVGWAVCAHGFVVFLRLFLMRTRLFGDQAIE